MVFNLLLCAVSLVVGWAAQVHAMSSPCLEYVACYNENYLDYIYMDIHHYDLSPRSASRCLSLCLGFKPSTQLVMAKIVQMNERLVCGCGENEAIGNGTGIVQDMFGCDRCPDGKEKCGGLETVSLYRVDRIGVCREGLNKGGLPFKTTTTTTSTTTTTTTTTIRTTTAKPYNFRKSEEGVENMTNLAYRGCVNKDSVNRSALSPHLLTRDGQETKQCLVTCTSSRYYEFLFLRIIGNGIFCGCGNSDVLTGPVNPAQCESNPHPHLGSGDKFAVYYVSGSSRCCITHYMYFLMTAAAALALMTTVPGIY